jgi:hypothetical protein
MFTDGANSGSVTFEKLLLSVTGTNSHLGNLTNDGTGSLVIDRSTMFACTNLFTLNGHAFLSGIRSQDFNCLNGFTLDGTMEGIDMTQYRSIGMVSGGTIFSDGGTLSVTGRAFFNGTNDVPSGATFCDFSDSNIVEDAGLELLNVKFTGAGTFFPNIDGTNVKSLWRNTQFPSIPPDNTHVGGGWHVADSGDEVINSTTPTVYTKVNGTTTPLDLQWFSGGTANDLTLDSSIAVNAELSGTIYFEGTNNATIQCKLVQDDGTPEDIFEMGEIEFIGTNAPLAYPFSGIPVILTSAATVVELHAKSSSGSFTMKVHSNLELSSKN